jgi:hypothetical protein
MLYDAGSLALDAYFTARLFEGLGEAGKAAYNSYKAGDWEGVRKALGYGSTTALFAAFSTRLGVKKLDEIASKWKISWGYPKEGEGRVPRVPALEAPPEPGIAPRPPIVPEPPPIAAPAGPIPSPEVAAVERALTKPQAFQAAAAVGPELFKTKKFAADVAVARNRGRTEGTPPWVVEKFGNKWRVVEATPAGAPAAAPVRAPAPPAAPTIEHAPPEEIPHQPWEVTAQDYADWEADHRGERPWPVTRAYRGWHHEQVAGAVQRGETVPEEVLAEYPDLAKAAAPTVPPERPPVAPEAVQAPKPTPAAIPPAEVPVVGASAPSDAELAEIADLNERARRALQGATGGKEPRVSVNPDGTITVELQHRVPGGPREWRVAGSFTGEEAGAWRSAEALPSMQRYVEQSRIFRGVEHRLAKSVEVPPLVQPETPVIPQAKTPVVPQAPPQVSVGAAIPELEAAKIAATPAPITPAATGYVPPEIPPELFAPAAAKGPLRPKLPGQKVGQTEEEYYYEFGKRVGGNPALLNIWRRQAPTMVAEWEAQGKPGAVVQAPKAEPTAVEKRDYYTQIGLKAAADPAFLDRLRQTAPKAVEEWEAKGRPGLETIAEGAPIPGISLAATRSEKVPWLADDSGWLTEAELEVFGRNKDFIALKDVITSTVYTARKVLAKKLPGATATAFQGPLPVQILLSHERYGMTVPSVLIGIEPFMSYRASPTPTTLAARVYNTVVHELAHQVIPNHDVPFKRAMLEFHKALGGAFAIRTRTALRKIYEKGIAEYKAARPGVSRPPGLEQTVALYNERRRRSGGPPFAIGREGIPPPPGQLVGGGEGGIPPIAPTGGAGGLWEGGIPAERAAAIAEERGDYPTAPPEYAIAKAAYLEERKAEEPFVMEAPEFVELFSKYGGEYSEWIGKINKQPAALLYPGRFPPGITFLQAFMQLTPEEKTLFGFPAWLAKEKGQSVRQVEPIPIEGAVTAAQVDALLDSVFKGIGPPSGPSTPELPPEARAEIRGDIVHFNRWHKYAETLLQIGYANPEVEPLQRYINLIQDWWARRTEVTMLFDNVGKDWISLGRKRGGKLSAAITEARLTSIRKRRRMTDPERIALFKKHGLDEATVKVYEKIEGVFATSRDWLETAMLDEFFRTKKNITEITAAQKQTQKEFDAMRNRDYFPFVRFGRHMIRIRAVKPVEYAGRKFKAGALVGFFGFEDRQSRALEFKRLEKELKAAGKYDSVEMATSYLADQQYAFAGFPPTLMDMFEDRLKLDKEQMRALKEVVVDMMPGRAFVHRMQRARGTPGWNENAQRAFASYGEQISHHIARVEHRPRLLEAIADLRKMQMAAVGPQAHKFGELAAHLDAHYDHVMNPGNELAAIRGWFFTWYFLFVPRQMFVNSTQLMYTWAHLSALLQKTGKSPVVADAIVMQALAKAAKDVTMSFRFKKLGFADVAKVMPAEDQALMLRSIKGGFAKESFSTELAGMAHGTLLHRMLPQLPLLPFIPAPVSKVALAVSGKTDRAIRKTMELGVLPFSLSEEANRRTSILAAARIFRRYLGGDEGQAYKFVRDVVQKTQMEYAAWNRPRVMWGKKSLFFMFKSFTLGSLYLAMALPGGGRFWLAMLLMAGLMGLPFAEDVKEMVNTLATMGRKAFGLKNPKWDVVKEVREYCAKIGMNPELLLHGFGRTTLGLHNIARGFGLPFPALDLSGSLGLGRVIPGVQPIAKAIQGAVAGRVDFPAFFTRLTQDLMGAGGATGMNFVRAQLEDSPDVGHYLRTFLFPGAMNLLKAAEMFFTGQATTADGTRLVTFDVTNTEHIMEILGQALGMTPTRVRQTQEQELAQREAISFYAVWREALLASLAQAVTSEKETLIQDADKAVQSFNERCPSEFAITYRDRAESIRRRLKTKELRDSGLPTERRYLRMYQEYEKLFPKIESLPRK